MAWLQLKFTIDSFLAENLGEQLSAEGAVAVTMADGANQAIFEILNNGTSLWDQTTVTALFMLDINIEKVLAAIKNYVPAATFNTKQIDFVSDKNWVEDYKQQWEPIKFGKHLWICPSWKKVTEPNAVVIELDPGLAFGTGTHPTTALCLEWLEANCNQAELVIDYGCGSGILAIAAAKLGAKQVIAIDNDPQALLATQENAERNQLSAPGLVAVSPESQPLAPADILLANILAQPLIDLAAEFSHCLKPGGRLILSGILREQAEQVLQAYAPWFLMAPTVYKEEWARLEGVRRT